MREIRVDEVMSISLTDIWNIEPGRYTLIFDDGQSVPSTMRRIVFNRHLWEMFVGEQVPIVHQCSLDYVLGEDGVLNTGTHTTCLNNIFKHICAFSGFRYYHQKEHLLKKAVDVTNLIFNNIILNIGQSVVTIKAMDFVTLLEMPEIVEIHSQLEDTPESVEQTHGKLTEFIMKTKKKHPLVLVNQAGVVKNSQFNQCMGPRGYVTDLDRTVFGYGILNGFIRGLHTLYEIATESRTAAKALNAADFSIRESEYTSRRFAITAMVIEQPVPVDCGSTIYRTCLMTRRYLTNMKGKWYVDPETSKLMMINGDEEHLIGQMVKYRHINGCMWHNRKQVCTTCAGALSENLKENTNLGAESVLNFMHDVTQKILSFKHETKSVGGNAVVLEEVASLYFRAGDENELYIKPTPKLKDLRLVLNKNGLDKLMDVLTVSDLDIPMSNIGEVSVVGIVSEDGSISDVATISNDDRKANITRELLRYIKDDNNKFELDSKGNYVIPLVNWKTGDPLFTIPLKEADTMSFLRELKTMIESTGKRKLSTEDHFFALADLVLGRSNCNFTILEVLAYAITAFNIDDGNFRLSRGSSSIQLAQRDDIFRHRSKGQLLPYEKQLPLLVGKPHEAFSNKYGEGHPLDVQFMPQEMLMGN